MNYLMIILAIITFTLFLIPIKRKKINFDEKGYAIKVYKEELKILEHRKIEKKLDEETFNNLKQELDRKSSLAILAIDKKKFSYQSHLPAILITLFFLILISVLYKNYYDKKVLGWSSFQNKYNFIINKGILDKNIIKKVNKENLIPYCFSLQQQILKDYSKNPDALANLAFCQMQTGYNQISDDAIKVGLNINKEHTELNFLLAKNTLLRTGELSTNSISALKTILKKNPNHRDTLWLLGIYAYNKGDAKNTKYFLSKLEKIVGKNPEISELLKNIEQSTQSNDNQK